MKKTDHDRPIKPRLRILLGAEIAIGPGKVDLLDAIARTGSISAAAREIGVASRMIISISGGFRYSSPAMFCEH